MTAKRKVGPGGGDFALNPNRFGGVGGGGRTGFVGQRVGGKKITKNPEKGSINRQLIDKRRKDTSKETKKIGKQFKGGLLTKSEAKSKSKNAASGARPSIEDRFKTRSKRKK